MQWNGLGARDDHGSQVCGADHQDDDELAISRKRGLLQVAAKEGATVYTALWCICGASRSRHDRAPGRHASTFSFIGVRRDFAAVGSPPRSPTAHVAGSRVLSEREEYVVQSGSVDAYFIIGTPRDFASRQ